MEDKQDKTSGKPAFGFGGEVFSIGGVLRHSVEVLMKNPTVFFGLALAASAPLVLVGLMVAMVPGGSFISVGLGLFVGLVVQGALAYSVFQTMSGRNVTFGETLQRGLVRIVPVMITSVIAAVGTALGSMLFVIPGLILMCMWAVAVPACVVEKLDATASLRRSYELTKGNRLPIFGLVMLVGIISSILQSLVTMTMGAVLGTVVALIASTLVGAIPQAFNAVLMPIIYFELRSAKEGISLENLANVFD